MQVERGPIMSPWQTSHVLARRLLLAERSPAPFRKTNIPRLNMIYIYIYMIYIFFTTTLLSCRLNKINYDFTMTLLSCRQRCHRKIVDEALLI